MADNTSTDVPANAPWLGDWKTVAKASGDYIPPEKPQGGVVEAVKGVIKPWLMEWGLIAKQAPVAPSKATVPVAPSSVDVSTEAGMKKAVVIQPHERMPDTQSLASNLAEIDLEIKNAKDKGVRDILVQQRARLAKESNIRREAKGFSEEEFKTFRNENDRGKINKLLIAASDNPEYSKISSYLMDSRAIPTIKVGHTSGANAEFEKPGWGPSEVQSNGTVTMNWGGFNKEISKAQISTLTHEFTHAAEDQLWKQFEDIRKKSDRTPEESQFLGNFAKMYYPSDRVPTTQEQSVKAMNRKWFEENQNYRTSSVEARAWAVGNVASDRGYDAYDTPPHVDPTTATEFMMLLEQGHKLIKNKPHKGR